MAAANGLKVVGYFDCPGGGQVVVRDNVAYVGHVKPPHGTTLVDVSDPGASAPAGRDQGSRKAHSRTRCASSNGVMLVNREIFPTAGRIRTSAAGSRSTTSASPQRRARSRPSAARGVHRFTFDGRYAYVSPELDGYLGNIVMILDLNDPAKPQEVGRWWMPGQWTAGGETPTWKGAHHRCHHPIRLGDRLYVSYWHGGFVILDIADMAKPKFVSGLDWSPPFTWPTHTALPLPFPLQRPPRACWSPTRTWPGLAPGPPAFLWLVDITDETQPDAVRELPGRRESTARRSPSSPAATSPARRCAARRSRSPGSPTGSASSTSPIPMRRARWPLHARVPPGAAASQSNDVCCRRPRPDLPDRPGRAVAHPGAH